MTISCEWQAHEKDQALTTTQSTLNSSLKREEAAVTASTEKDISLMRLGSELKQAQEKAASLAREVGLTHTNKCQSPPLALLKWQPNTGLSPCVKSLIFHG